MAETNKNKNVSLLVNSHQLNPLFRRGGGLVITSGTKEQTDWASVLARFDAVFLQLEDLTRRIRRLEDAAAGAGLFDRTRAIRSTEDTDDTG
jgi:hypothetical protein